MPCAVLSCFSRVRLSVMLCTVACQAPLSMGFPRQEYWERVAISFSRESFQPRVEPVSPALAGGFFTTKPPGKELSISRVLPLLCNIFLSYEIEVLSEHFPFIQQSYLQVQSWKKRENTGWVHCLLWFIINCIVKDTNLSLVVAKRNLPQRNRNNTVRIGDIPQRTFIV